MALSHALAFLLAHLHPKNSLRIIAYALVRRPQYPSRILIPQQFGWRQKPPSIFWKTLGSGTSKNRAAPPCRKHNGDSLPATAAHGSAPCVETETGMPPGKAPPRSRYRTRCMAPRIRVWAEPAGATQWFASAKKPRLGQCLAAHDLITLAADRQRERCGIAMTAAAKLCRQQRYIVVAI